MSEIRIVKGDLVSNLRKDVFSFEQGYPEDKLFDDKENSADFSKHTSRLYGIITYLSTAQSIFFTIYRAQKLRS